VGPTLLSLVRKDLIKPGRSSRRADDAFRFAHALVRDAAYTRISKEARATLHEEFAVWLGASADDTLELDELLGYHYEQAVQARADTVLADAIAAAEARGNVRQAERATVERVALRLHVDPGFGLDEAQSRARAAIDTFTRSGDELGLARAWRLLADVDWARLRLTEMEASLEQALRHATRAGDQREASEIAR